MSTNQEESEAPVYLGHYRIEKTLGQGSYGKVKLATNTKTNQKVALKFILKSNIKKPVHMTRIKREVRLLKLLSHPNIVKLYEVAETNQEIILTMENADGGELFDYIVAQHRLKDKEARKIFRQIISAVDYCHSNCVIHRDLKPENVLLDHDRNIKVIDFGFANMFDPDGLMATFCGSPFYASPEMILGKKYIGPEVDLWSLGVILFALLCGHLPFDDSNMKKLYNKIIEGKFTIPDYVSPSAKDLITRLIVTDPTTRGTLDMVRNHAWLNEEYDQPPLSFLPERPLPTNLDDAIVNKLTTYGFEADAAIQRIMNDSKSPAFCTYYLILEKAKREEEAAKSSQSAITAAPEETKDAGSEVKSKSTSGEESSTVAATEDDDTSANKRRARTLTGDGGKYQAAAAAAIQNLKPTAAANTATKEGNPPPVVIRRKNAGEDAAVTSTVKTTGAHRRHSVDTGAAAATAAALSFAQKMQKDKANGEESSKNEVAADGSSKDEVKEGSDLHVVKGLFNVSTTSNKTPEEIIQEVTRVLSANNVKFTLASYTFNCQDISSGAMIKFEIEICKIQRLSLHGLHLRRVEGDTWAYKKLCHKITSQLRL